MVTILIFAEPGTLVSDGLVPRTVRCISRHPDLRLHPFVDVSEDPSPKSYLEDLPDRFSPRQVAEAVLRKRIGRPKPLYPNCRAWATAPHTPDIRILEASNPNADEFKHRVKEIDPDTIFLLRCSHILDGDYVEPGEFDIINYHWLSLTEYAGRHLTFWAPYNGESEHGITFHKISKEVDEGEALVQKRVRFVPGLQPSWGNASKSAVR